MELAVAKHIIEMDDPLVIDLPKEVQVEIRPEKDAPLVTVVLKGPHHELRLVGASETIKNMALEILGGVVRAQESHESDASR